MTVQFFWKGRKNLKKSPTCFDANSNSCFVKTGGRFFQILWPSQYDNVLALAGLDFLYWKSCLSRLKKCLLKARVYKGWPQIFNLDKIHQTLIKNHIKCLNSEVVICKVNLLPFSNYNVKWNKIENTGFVKKCDEHVHCLAIAVGDSIPAADFPHNLSNCPTRPYP